MSVLDIETRLSDIWAYDLATGAGLRLTQEGDNFLPRWAPDGERVPELNAAWKLPGDFFTLGKRSDFGRLGALRRARLYQHLHKNAGLRLYGALALARLRERFRW